MSKETDDKTEGTSGIKVHRATTRRSFMAALGVGVTTSAALLGAGSALAQGRRRMSDQKVVNDRDYYQNGDIKAPISNQGRYADGDRSRSNDMKQNNDRD
jgi:hypothetical protein